MAAPHDEHHEHGPLSHARVRHSHGAVEPALLSSVRGMRAVRVSLLGLLATALLQVIIAVLSGSVALLADTIHNLGDAFTAIPLWIAFRLGQLKPSKRFTYGYGRLEDMAGLIILLAILASAALAGYQSFQRLREPQPVRHLWVVALASVIGFLGNEAVALYRIRVGKQIGSAALVADGYHARVDGITSLAVLAGTAGVWLGYPLADPIAGLLITLAILRIAWETGRSVFTRLLDGVDPEVVDEIHHAAGHVQGALQVSEVRVRWLGHRMHAELNVTVPAGLTVEQGHHIAQQICDQLLRHLPYLTSATVHVDPPSASGEGHHPTPAGDFPPE